MAVKLQTRPPKAKPVPSGEDAPHNHLYLQVAHALRDEIVAGRFPIGSRLPTEEELCARFNVSRYTVREALKRLREDNLVASRQGAGTIVAPRRASDAYAHDVMSINDLVSWSVGKTFMIENMELLAIDEKLAARAGLEPNGEWLVVRGWGHDDGVKTPICWAEYYIHKDYAAVGRLLQRHSGPIFPLIEDLFGLRITEVAQDVGASLMSAPLAAGLKVKAGTAALEIRRSYKLPSGKVAQVTISTYPAARFRHETTLKRVKG